MSRGGDIVSCPRARAATHANDKSAYDLAWEGVLVHNMGVVQYKKLCTVLAFSGSPQSTKLNCVLNLIQQSDRHGIFILHQSIQTP